MYDDAFAMRACACAIDLVLGKGGFGIVYLAFDTRLERLVALKEFMPQSLAARVRAILDERVA